MKNIILYSIFLGGGFLLLSSCAKKSFPVKNTLAAVSAFSPVYPVLTGDRWNPVFRINIQPTTELQVNIQEFSINLKGSTSLDDIAKIAVFYTGANEEFSTDQLYSQTNTVSDILAVKGNQTLGSENNYFWLSIVVSERADLDHLINASIRTVKINQSPVSIVTPAPHHPKRMGLALRDHHVDGVHTYRIPGLATTNEGTLIAVYDVRRAGSGDLQADIDVGMSRSSDAGNTWEPMKIVMDMREWGGLPSAENGIGDPCILVDRQTNTIWLAALWIHGKADKPAWFTSQPGLSPEETGQLMLVKSEDDGHTWSAPINITEQIKNPEWFLLLDGPGKGIQMDDGTLVFPAQFKDKHQVPHATIITSKDHGITWSVGSGAKSNTTEAQVVELSDHALMLNMRDDLGTGPEGRNGTGARSVAISRDLGKSWTEHPSSRVALAEPVCMASLINHRYQGRDLLLFSNPFDQYDRQNISIRVSEDEGLSWSEKYYTLIDEGQGRGYSCMTSIDEDTIGILYESSQADLVFQRIKMADLLRER